MTPTHYTSPCICVRICVFVYGVFVSAYLYMHLLRFACFGLLRANGGGLGYNAYALQGTTRHYHCLRETLKVTVYHAGTSQDNDGRADKTGLDLDAYECVGGAPPTKPGKVV